MMLLFGNVINIDTSSEILVKTDRYHNWLGQLFWNSWSEKQKVCLSEKILWISERWTAQHLELFLGSYFPSVIAGGLYK